MFCSKWKHMESAYTRPKSRLICWGQARRNCFKLKAIQFTCVLKIRLDERRGTCVCALFTLLKRCDCRGSHMWNMAWIGRPFLVTDEKRRMCPTFIEISVSNDKLRHFYLTRWWLILFDKSRQKRSFISIIFFLAKNKANFEQANKFEKVKPEDCMFH